MEMSLRTASLYYHTLRYLKPCQIYGRLAHMSKAVTYRLLSPALKYWYGRRARQNVQAFDPLRTTAWLPFCRVWLDPARPRRFDPDDLLRGRFSFLNQTRTFDGPMDWRPVAMSKLWRYQLHYFDYLVDLAVAYSQCSDMRYLERLKYFAADWIVNNPLGFGDGWEPYPLSLRLVNWIKAYALITGTGSQARCNDSAFHTDFLTSLYTQAGFLEHNVERHLLGNHLIKNAKALLFAGLFFDGADAARWRRQGQALLEAQLDEQVLTDGGHFERSPMYHAIVLEDLAESLALLKQSGIA